MEASLLTLLEEAEDPFANREEAQGLECRRETGVEDAEGGAF